MNEKNMKLEIENLKKSIFEDIKIIADNASKRSMLPSGDMLHDIQYKLQRCFDFDNAIKGDFDTIE